MTELDVRVRFPRTTLAEAYARSQESERWVFEETISASVTMLYGRSNVGKSYLVASLLLSLLVEGRHFLGMQPTDPTKLWRPAILWTDPGSDEEYAERVYKALPDRTEVELPMYHVGRTVRPDEWELLAAMLLAEGHNFVVLDNLMGVTGDTNEAANVTTVFDGLNRLTSRGVPVVVLHHESEHGVPVAGAAPMGASVAVQKSRAWIQVRQSARRGLRGGNTALIVQGNQLDQPRQIVAEPMAGPNYRVLNSGPWVARTEEPAKPKRDRSPATLDKNAEAARWIVDNCQGMPVRATARAAAEQFGGSPESWKSKISTGAVSKLLDRQADTWSLTSVAA